LFFLILGIDIQIFENTNEKSIFEIHLCDYRFVFDCMEKKQRGGKEDFFISFSTTENDKYLILTWSQTAKPAASQSKTKAHQISSQQKNQQKRNHSVPEM